MHIGEGIWAGMMVAFAAFSGWVGFWELVPFYITAAVAPPLIRIAVAGGR